MIDKNEKNIIEGIVNTIKNRTEDPGDYYRWPEDMSNISLEDIKEVKNELVEKYSKCFTSFLLMVVDDPKNINIKKDLINYMEGLIKKEDPLINLEKLKDGLLSSHRVNNFQALFTLLEGTKNFENSLNKLEDRNKKRLVMNFIQTHENIAQLETFFTQHTWAKEAWQNMYELPTYKNAARIAMTKALNDLSEQKTPNCDSLGLYCKLLYPNGKIPYEQTSKILNDFFNKNTELNDTLKIEVIEKLLHISTIRVLEGVDQSNEEAKEAAEKAMFSDFFCLVEISNFFNATPEKDASKTLNLDEPVKSLKKALEIFNPEELNKLLDAASVMCKGLYSEPSNSDSNEQKISEFEKATFAKKREMLKGLKKIAINNIHPKQKEQKEQKNLFFDSIDTLLEYAEKKEEQEKTQKEEKERQEKERQEEQKKNSMKKALVIGAIVGCGLTAAIYATSTIALASPLAIALIVISSLVAAGIGFYGDQKWAEYSAQKGEKMDTAEIAL